VTTSFVGVEFERVRRLSQQISQRISNLMRRFSRLMRGQPLVRLSLRVRVISIVADPLRDRARVIAKLEHAIRVSLECERGKPVHGPEIQPRR
jgi:hypothetical protein